MSYMSYRMSDIYLVVTILFLPVFISVGDGGVVFDRFVSLSLPDKCASCYTFSLSFFLSLYLIMRNLNKIVERVYVLLMVFVVLINAVFVLLVEGELQDRFIIVSFQVLFMVFSLHAFDVFLRKRFLKLNSSQIDCLDRYKHAILVSPVLVIYLIKVAGDFYLGADENVFFVVRDLAIYNYYQYYLCVMAILIYYALRVNLVGVGLLMKLLLLVASFFVVYYSYAVDVKIVFLMVAVYLVLALFPGMLNANVYLYFFVIFYFYFFF